MEPENGWRVWVIDPIGDFIDNCNACTLEAYQEFAVVVQRLDT